MSVFHVVVFCLQLSMLIFFVVGENRKDMHQLFYAKCINVYTEAEWTVKLII